MILAVLVSSLAGVLIVIARNINSLLAERIGLFPGTLFNYITGLALSIVFLFISGEAARLSFGSLEAVPFEAYLGGLLGVVVVVLSNIVTSKISAFYMSLIIFAGQLFTGIIIDYFVLGLLSAGKVIGGFLVVAGLVYNLRLDSRTIEK